MKTPRLRDKDVRKLVRRLQEEGLVVGLQPCERGVHAKLILPDGHKVPVCSTPSDRRSLLNLEAQVRRLAKTGT